MLNLLVTFIYLFYSEIVSALFRGTRGQLGSQGKPFLWPGSFCGAGTSDFWTRRMIKNSLQKCLKLTNLR